MDPVPEAQKYVKLRQKRKENQRKAKLGKKLSEETKKKLSIINTGKKSRIYFVTFF